MATLAQIHAALDSSTPATSLAGLHINPKRGRKAIKQNDKLHLAYVALVGNERDAEWALQRAPRSIRKKIRALRARG